MSKSQILPSHTFKGLPDDVHFHVQAEDAGKLDQACHEIGCFGVNRVGRVGARIFPTPVLDHSDAQDGGRSASAADERVNEDGPFDGFASANVNEVQPALPGAHFEQRLAGGRVAVLVPGDVLVKLHERAVHHFRAELNLLVVVARTQKRLDCFHLVRDSHVERAESVSCESLVHIAHYRCQVVQDPHEVLRSGDVLAGDGRCAQVQ